MEIGYLLYFQEVRMSAPAFVNQIFVFLESMVTGMFPILLASVIYWSIDKKIGVYMFANYGGAFHLNQLLKGFECIPRPWIKDSRIMPYRYVEDYAFPSTTATFATATYGTAGICARKKFIWFSAVSAFLVFITSFSGIWLGMYTPQDILVGIMITLLWMYLANRILLWIDENPKQDILIALLGSAITILITEYLMYKEYPILQATHGMLVPNGPEGSIEAMYSCGFCLGILAGWVLERRFVGFRCAGSLKERVLCGCIGVVVTLAVSFGARTLLNIVLTDNATALWSNFLTALTIVFVYPFFWKLVRKNK